MRQQAKNFYAKERAGYELPVGSQVQARVVRKLFDKEVLTADPKPYTVESRGKGGLYTLRRGKETTQKWRRDLRPVPNSSTTS